MTHHLVFNTAVALVLLSGCSLSSAPKGDSDNDNDNDAATLSGVTATVDTKAIKVSHGIAFSENGSETTLLLTDYPIGCKDAGGLIDKDKGNNILLKLSRRVQTDGSYPYQLTQVGIFPQSETLEKPTTMDWAPATKKGGLAGSIDLSQVLTASEVFKIPERKLAVKGKLSPKHCGNKETSRHPSRPQKDLKLTVTGNPFSVTSAILRPDARDAGKWELQLGSNPATCESTYPDGALIVRMKFDEGGAVEFMHLAGDAVSPQLNFNGSADEPHVAVRPSSGFPDTGEVSLTLKGSMKGLGHEVGASGKVSAVICPK